MEPHGFRRPGWRPSARGTAPPRGLEAAGLAHFNVEVSVFNATGTAALLSQGRVRGGERQGLLAVGSLGWSVRR